MFEAERTATARARTTTQTRTPSAFAEALQRPMDGLRTVKKAAATAMRTGAKAIGDAAGTLGGSAEAIGRTIGASASSAAAHFASSFRSMATASYFAPRTWQFWVALIIAFCACCIVGHWMEWFYCLNMDALFGIVEDDYAINIDPWYHPYWVYGFGAIGMTLFIEPLKELIVKKTKTAGGAFLITLVFAIVLAMLMELGFGLLVNQPNAAGEYPFWDNSKFPLNIMGQAWLVNDVFIGLAAMAYIWVIFPLINKGISMLKPRTANKAFVGIVVAFCGVCALSYTQLILQGVIG